MTATILVVDDEPDLEALVLQKFRRQIRDGAVSFLFAHDGVEALELIVAHPHVDMVARPTSTCRGWTGCRCWRKLQEAEDRKSTVIVSAYGDMSNIRTAMNRGAFDFLTKPIDFADLETTIDKTLRHVEMMRDARRAPGRGRARARRAVALFLAADRAPPRLRRRGRRHGGAPPRGRDHLHRHHRLHRRWWRRTDPELLGALLNEYLGGMTEIVFDHEGTVAKIIGDAIHVLFSAPGRAARLRRRARSPAPTASTPGPKPSRALARPSGVKFGTTRIGVHAGPALVGNFGGGRFFDYTAYGDTINTAARLEAANKFLGTRICVSASVGGRLRRLQRPPGRRPDAARPQRTAAGLRAAVGGSVRRRGRRSNMARRSPSWRPAMPRAMPAFAALVGRACG